MGGVHGVCYGIMLGDNLPSPADIPCTRTSPTGTDNPRDIALNYATFRPGTTDSGNGLTYTSLLDAMYRCTPRWRRLVRRTWGSSCRRAGGRRVRGDRGERAGIKPGCGPEGHAQEARSTCLPWTKILNIRDVECSMCSTTRTRGAIWSRGWYCRFFFSSLPAHPQECLNPSSPSRCVR